MSNFNALHNRAVWFDIPVSDVGRAAEFYRAVLNVKVEGCIRPSMSDQRWMAVA